MREVIPTPVPGLDLRREYGHHQSPAIRAGGGCCGAWAVVAVEGTIVGNEVNPAVRAGGPARLHAEEATVLVHLDVPLPERVVSLHQGGRLVISRHC